MPQVNVNIQPAIIQWALNQTSEDQLGVKLMHNIEQWLSGTKTPTFNQVEDFSKKSNIPLGYFFLKTPPIEQINLLEFRTVDSIELANPSRNLIDTIHHMEDVQEWMSSYRQELEFECRYFVGKMKGFSNAHMIASAIREDLGLDLKWYQRCSNVREAFGMVRTLLENVGVLVMMNGIVGANTHRKLNINEFRAFVLLDQWAPLIFINSADSDGAKLFSLFHEIAHIWIGSNDLFNDRRGRGGSATESLCNAIAAELMVPQNAFLEEWSACKDEDEIEKIQELAKVFKCSTTVAARRALDYNKITAEVYSQVAEDAIKAYELSQTNKSGGGNYYNTMGTRLDGGFVRALSESVRVGRTSYTEAYRLTNSNGKTFDEIVARKGGVR